MRGNKNYEYTKSWFQNMRRGLATVNKHTIEKHDIVNEIYLHVEKLGCKPRLQKA